MKKIAFIAALLLTVINHASAQRKPIVRTPQTSPIAGGTTNSPSTTPIIGRWDRESLWTGKGSKEVKLFGNDHPCGIAVSGMGRVAVCTYEGDRKDGSLYIWNSFSDFYDAKAATYKYTLNNPEAVAFDSNENLFISSVYNNKIYYMTDLSKAPTAYFDIIASNATAANKPWNPRGLSTDGATLYIMCENLYPNVHASSIVAVTTPAQSNRTITVLGGSSQDKENALSVAYMNGNLYATDLFGGKVRAYSINGNSLVPTNSLSGIELPLDITSDGTDVYFTHIENNQCVLKKWNPSSSSATLKENFGPVINNFAAWGLAKAARYIVVADGARNRVRIIER